MINPAFSQKLNDISQQLGMNPRDLLLVMYLESGVKSSAINPDGHAAGLIQFIPPTLKGLGVPENQINQFNKVPATQQLDYVKKYIQNQMNYAGREFKSAPEYYHANFFPKTLTRWNGHDPIRNQNVIVVDSRSNDPKQREAYQHNSALDVNKDGKITVGDLTHFLLNVYKSPGYQKMLDTFNQQVENQPKTQPRNMTNFTRENQSTQHQEEPGMLSSFLSRIEKFLDSAFASKFSETQLKKFAGMEEGNFLIAISDENNKLSNKLEFARLLSLALKEGLDAGIEIFTNDNKVELECQVFGEKELNLELIKEICYDLSDEFKTATKQIGGIKIYSMIIPQGKSDFKELDITVAESNYRQFRLQFCGRKS